MTKQVFNISLEEDYDLHEAMERAIKVGVQDAIRAQVDEAVKEEIGRVVRSEVEQMVKDALRTKVQIFNYDGSIQDERSFEQAMKAALKEINTQGVNFKIKTGSYSNDNKTVADVIKDDMYQMMTKRLKPFFDKIEADFHAKSMEQLRQFAITAIDNSNKKALRGY